MSISNIAEGIGSQAAFKIDASTSLSMTFKRWVNCYIVTKKIVKPMKNPVECSALYPGKPFFARVR